LSDHVVEVVALAERNAIRLMALIEDILDLERLETANSNCKSPTSNCLDSAPRDGVARLLRRRASGSGPDS
jgi:hypothetical protein